MADQVIVYPTDVAETDDINRLATFSETAFELLLEAITQGQRSLLWGGVLPAINTAAAPDVTVTVPQQYFAIEARSALFPLTAQVVTHPAPAANYDFYIYLMLRLEDISEMRDNVNPGTFVVIPTARTTYREEQVEMTVLSVPAGDPAPTPPTGPGVPAPQYERLGYVLVATFTWDGVNVVAPAVIMNSAAVVTVGSAGLPLHGATHVTVDPIPYPAATTRGMMPPKTLPYLKQSLSRAAAAAGSPITVAVIGSNGPAGDTNYDTYNAGTCRGIELDIATNASLQVAAGQLGVVYGAPTGGVAGTNDEAARSDHEHIALPATPNYFAGGVITAGPGAFAACPVAATPITIDAGRPNQIVMLQVDFKNNGPDSGDLPMRFVITGGGAVVRTLVVESSGTGDRVAWSTFVMTRLNGAGQITIQGFGADPTRIFYRIAYVGSMGQG